MGGDVDDVMVRRFSMLLLLVLLGSCSPKTTGGNRGAEVAVETPAEDRPERWTDRAEWLAAADELLRTLERREAVTAEDRKRLDALAATTLWTIDNTNVTAELEPFEAFLSRNKRLIVALVGKGTADDLIPLAVLNVRVQISMIAAAEAFIDHLPKDDPTTPARREGLETMRLGVAIMIGSLLAFAVDAADRRKQAFAILQDPAIYRGLSRQGLQLLVATFDESLPRLLPSSRLTPAFERVRAVVEREHAKRPPDGSVRITYQGLTLTRQSSSRPVEIVSRTGGFAVALKASALAKRVEILSGGRVVAVQHHVELREGNTMFEAMCFDNQSASAIQAQLDTSGALEPRESKGPGSWFDIRIPGRAGAIRFLDIDNRGCAVSVEGPAGQVDQARAEAFLSSFRKAPVP